MRAAAGPGCEIRGFVRREELLDLYRRATLLVYPSAYEGFGLPVVEAMAAGCPVLCARNSSLIEIGGRSALFLDEVTPEAIAAALADALADREALAERGRGGPRGGRRATPGPRRRPRPGTSTGRRSADDRRPARAGVGDGWSPTATGSAAAGLARGAPRAAAGRSRARALYRLLVPLEPWRYYELARVAARAVRRATASTSRARSCWRACSSARGAGGGRRSTCCDGRDRALAGARPGARPAGGGRAGAPVPRRRLRRDRLRVGDRARRGRRGRGGDGGDVAGAAPGRASCTSRRTWRRAPGEVRTARPVYGADERAGRARRRGPPGGGGVLRAPLLGARRCDARLLGAWRGRGGAGVRAGAAAGARALLRARGRASFLARGAAAAGLRAQLRRIARPGGAARRAPSASSTCACARRGPEPPRYGPAPEARRGLRAKRALDGSTIARAPPHDGGAGTTPREARPRCASTTDPSPSAGRSERDRRRCRRDARFLPLLAGPRDRRVRRAAVGRRARDARLTACFAGIYAALAFKLLVQGDEVDSGAIWAVEQKALPLAATTMILVFAKNRLYAPARATRRRGAAALVGHAHHRRGARGDARRRVALRHLLHLLRVLDPRRGPRRRAAGELRQRDGPGARRDPLRAAGAAGRRARAGRVDRGEPGALREPPGRARTGSSGRAPAHARASGDETGGAGRGDLRRGARPGRDRRGDPDRLGRRRRAGAGAARGLPPPRRSRCGSRPTTAELLSHSVQAVPAPGLPLFELRPPVLGGAAFLAKRAFDLVVGSLIGLLVAPVLAVAALAIKLEDRGPVIHRSRRVGVEEQEFTCLKLRTMRSAPRSEQDEPRGAPTRPTARSSRSATTRASPGSGAVLRRFSIDELPAALERAARARCRWSARGPCRCATTSCSTTSTRSATWCSPGMTGLWQVSGPQRPLVRRAGAARLLLHRDLVDLARPDDHGPHDPGGPRPAGGLLSTPAPDPAAPPTPTSSCARSGPAAGDPPAAAAHDSREPAAVGAARAGGGAGVAGRAARCCG